ncbi:tRNA (guanosine(46)-N7)-methyltransferase TrmB [Phormidesmis priestleyi ULC007]|uniref:tRNA (guanine-N(7)-)-methyltransferase n=1 Tax=Phormidesmis priestleyi ULC007 TaxID=1920490 RepID=A0A2T1DGR0_9CYAN|nr:tRNA (guanosine(46)-N7)-methyltransferase TrmB [Phormidesmis priestleyi]PSB19682.1 tRNA (guanosine(46)-N7)-methyltransferase TrmB [Phormidesmis priestleyi ULC007]PZO53566.1 MAG: tRNA (guanosine(46)-N7)-methyltransferase TrmB [Phormidesmis priestleyi]
MAIVRVREHVNPLSRKYQTPAQSPDWEKIYADLTQPLHLDIGCGRGRFLLKMAQLQPEWNFLGLEIREPLVEQALSFRDELGLQNLHYLFCNVNNSLPALFTNLEPGTLQQVTIQFPDPWFKRKHQKRRVVQPQVVEELALHLSDRGQVFVQSDVEEVAIEMVDRFSAHAAFQRQGHDWLSDNPLPVPTERESSTIERGEAVYRALFNKV